VDPNLMLRIGHIESGLNPRSSKGSYHGLFQLSQGEFQKYGGGNIWDAGDNARAAARKTAAETAQFQQTYGRAPTPTEIYMQHQQGPAGAAAHMANPGAPAWQNMASTGEGKQKGSGWARQAIWGNIPDSFKKQFPGGVDTVSSQDFMNIWKNKVEGGGDFSPTGVSASAAPAGLLTNVRAPSAAWPGTSNTPGLLGQQDQSKNAIAAAQTGLGLLNGPEMPAPPPMQINYPVPPGLAAARAAALRGVFGGGTT